VIRSKNTVVVEGLNLRQRLQRPTPNTKGSFVQMESPIHYSNVQLVDPVSKKPTRTRIRYLEDGSKVRLAAKSGAIIPKPNLYKKPERKENPATDTKPEIVLEKTYVEPVYKLVDERYQLVLSPAKQKKEDQIKAENTATKQKLMHKQAKQKQLETMKAKQRAAAKANQTKNPAIIRLPSTLTRTDISTTSSVASIIPDVTAESRA